MGIGDWGLGIGDWGLGIGPNPQSPIPNPQSPIPNKNVYNIKINFFKEYKKYLFILLIIIINFVIEIVKLNYKIFVLVII